MKNQLHNIIRLKEKSSYVVPALALRRADTKEVLGYFPDYDPKTFGGTKTILDSGTSFNLLPTDMADKIATELIASARQRGLYNKLPKNFFRTDRGASTQVAKFNNLKQIRQFPSFEITFEGADGNVKALELSPLHYLKEMSTTDPLIRTFAIRESRGPIVLGQPFLENHYVVLDRKNALVAFGDIDHACSY
jgi:hypothetical protein